MADVVGQMVVALTASATNLAKSITEESEAAGKQGSKTLTSSFTGGLAKLGAAVGGAFAVNKVWDFTKDVVSAASDLNESINAVTVTYQKVPGAAEGVLALGEKASQAYGMSKNTFNAFSVQMSGFAQSIAGPGGDVVGTLDTMTTRIADFASVQNMEMADAAALFQSALAGESEGMRRFGIDVSAATVEAYAHANGIGKAGEALTAQEKVLATNGLLMEATASTAGDFANTQDSLANSTKINNATWEDTKASLGESLMPIFQKFQGFLADVVIPLIQDKLVPAFEALGSFLLDSVIPAVQKVWDKFKEAWAWIEDNQGVLKGIATVITAVLLPAFVALGVQAVVSMAKTVAAWVVGAVGAVVNGAIMMATLMALGIMYVVNGIKAMAGFVMTVIGWVMSAAAAIVNAVIIAAMFLLAFWPITLIVVAIIGLIALIWIFWDEIKAALGKVWEFIKTTFSAIWQFIQAVWDGIVSAAKAAWQWIVDAVKWAIDFVWGLIVGYFNFVVGVWKAIFDAAKAAWDWIWGAIKGAVDKVWGFIQGLWTFISGVWTSIFTSARDAFANIYNAIKAKVDAVVSFVGELPGKIMGFFTGAATWLVDAGKNIVQGLIDGVKKLAGTIGNAFLNLLPGWIKGPFKAALGISSPSKVFAGYGQNIGEGLIIGMRAEAGSIEDASDALAEAAKINAEAVSPKVTGAGARGLYGSAANGGLAVNVYLGDRELRDLVRVEVEALDRGRAALVAMGGAV